MNTVTCGANEREANFIGKTVSEVKKELGDFLNIADDSKAYFSGNALSDDYIIQDGDSIEFVKEAGDKG